MPFSIGDKTLSSMLRRNLDKAKADETVSIQKMATGSKLEAGPTKPTDIAIAQKMEHRIRSLSAAKRSVNDAVSLMQTVDSTINEITNIITRMKEINLSAASSTVSDQERRYLFIEFQALHNEIDRIAKTTEFNGMPLLNGESDRVPDEMLFRIDDPYIQDSVFGDGEDLNTVVFTGLKGIQATTEALGLESAADLLEDSSEEEGVELEDVEELMVPDDDEYFATSYDQGIAILSTHRAVLGAMQSRFMRSLDFMDVYQENIAAAKSRIADTDYAEEVTNLIQSRIRVSATTSLLAQTNLSGNNTLQLIRQL